MKLNFEYLQLITENSSIEYLPSLQTLHINRRSLGMLLLLDHCGQELVTHLLELGNNRTHLAHEFLPSRDCLQLCGCGLELE